MYKINRNEHGYYLAKTSLFGLMERAVSTGRLASVPHKHTCPNTSTTITIHVMQPEIKYYNNELDCLVAKCIIEDNNEHN